MNNARYYDPVIGRFTQPDTIVPDGTNPQALNRYSYVENNPVRWNDPTGHCFTSAEVVEACYNASLLVGWVWYLDQRPPNTELDRITQVSLATAEWQAAGHDAVSVLGSMSTIELPDDVAAALAAAAAERGISIDELAAEALAERFATPAETGDAFAAFVGCMDSGDPDWAGTDTAVLRKAGDARRSA